MVAKDWQQSYALKVSSQERWKRQIFQNDAFWFFIPGVSIRYQSVCRAGAVAQLVEHSTTNPEVKGLIPALTRYLGLYNDTKR